MLLWDMHAVILSILGEITKGDQQIMTSQEDSAGYVIDYGIDTQREEYITTNWSPLTRPTPRRFPLHRLLRRRYRSTCSMHWEERSVDS